ncbi:pyridoxal phosphatase [Uliginosibacterium gangwonense]|uniref:pyridoxal phosphatase n=1 Tax=Uliginosibacterium gangwonense TaxID=392736 RepID=UPI00035E1099|nr:pyridoxal phosphatase [Uliginosibacterium gangwonense]
MKYKAVALDLDGTLLGSDLKIRHEVAETIQSVRAAGVRVLMVTGRHHSAAMPYHHQLGLDTPLMCCNGTYAWDTRSGRALMPRPLEKAQACHTLELVRQHGVHTLVYVDGSMTYEVVEPHLARILTWAESVPPALRPSIRQVANFEAEIEAAEHVWKFATTTPNLEHLHAFGCAVEQETGLSCEWSAKDRIDVAQQGNSKGRLLVEWLRSEGIAPEQTIAFGDSPNDISMLQAVGLGIAMGHSNEAVRTAAKLVAGSNDSAAIALALQEHVLDCCT